MELHVFPKFCFLCGRNFRNLSEWNHHLLTERHQDVARYSARNDYWRVFDYRECTMVIKNKTGIHLQHAAKIIGRISRVFSARGARLVVLDFAIWKQNPKVAVIQFKNRCWASQVWCGLGSRRQMKVDGKQFQFFRAVDLWEREWMQLIPSTDPFEQQDIK